MCEVKSNIEQLKEDVEFNKLNPRFADVDDDVLGQRKEGYFIKVVDEDEDGNSVFQIVMDNGHTYCANGSDVQRGKDVPDAFFIHKHIEKILYDFLASSQLPVRQTVFCTENEVEISSFIRMVIDRSFRIVNLTNILVPLGYEHHNHGKNLISQIYGLCKVLGYRLLLVSMVQGFYNKMVKRGATIIFENDVVEITDGTDLGQHSIKEVAEPLKEQILKADVHTFE